MAKLALQVTGVMTGSKWYLQLVFCLGYENEFIFHTMHEIDSRSIKDLNVKKENF